VCQLIRREDVKKENSDRRVALMPCFLHSGHNFIYLYIERGSGGLMDSEVG